MEISGSSRDFKSGGDRRRRDHAAHKTIKISSAPMMPIPQTHQAFPHSTRPAPKGFDHFLTTLIHFAQDPSITPPANPDPAEGRTSHRHDRGRPSLRLKEKPPRKAAVGPRTKAEQKGATGLSTEDRIGATDSSY